MTGAADSDVRDKVLLLGPSSLFWQETPADPTLQVRLTDSLRRATGDGLDIIVERTFFGPRMAQRVEELLTRHDPAAVLLYLGSGPFEAESVIEVIKHRWHGVYPWVLRASHLLKRAAGGGFDGSDGARGWLFRVPRGLGALLFGVDTTVSLEEAIASSIETIDVLSRFESTATVVYFSAVCWPPSFTRALALVAEFDARVREHCRRRRIGYWYRQEEMAKRAFEPHRGRDGMHADPATYACDAEILTSLLMGALNPVTAGHA
jgi:hypothetical protein